MPTAWITQKGSFSGKKPSFALNLVKKLCPAGEKGAQPDYSSTRPLKAFEHLETEERTVTRTEALTVNLASAGGFVAWLERQ